MKEYVLPDYAQLLQFLEFERKAFERVHTFGEIRKPEHAREIISFLQLMQTNLLRCFLKYPSLVVLFDQQFLPFAQFLQRDFVLETAFSSRYLFPVQEMLDLNAADLNTHQLWMQAWIDEIVQKHLASQQILKESFDLQLKSSDLSCQCTKCINDYRERLREAIYAECVELIDGCKVSLQQHDPEDFEGLSDLFYGLKKEVDQLLFRVRYRLKRSVLNRLEAQIKRVMRHEFNYPGSTLAQRQVVHLKEFFSGQLRRDGLRGDLIDDEYERFFGQLASNIWRGEKYLIREFKKLVKAVLLIKRKDISASILKAHLGEFWQHLPARKLKRKVIYHMGPTNSGKTYFAIEQLCQAATGCYLAPLRLLAGELFDTMNAKGVYTTLLTGEEVIEVEHATHYSSTVEMAKLQQVFDCCVIDEIQMMSDDQRGWAWTRAFVGMQADEIHLCGDNTVLNLVEEIVNLCGDTLEIKHYERMCELKVEARPVILGDLQRSDALIVFSRKKALHYKYDLEQLGFKVSIVYGRLSPEVRREQARKFDVGETDIIVSTDAIAMGMNLPIRRIIFSTLTKYIDAEEYQITDSEIKQVSGRAGRYKRFPVGYITCLARVEDGLRKINKATKMDLPQKTKCMVGPDLEIFNQVNSALAANSLPELKLSEFLHLFNTMTFKKPFFGVDLKEMIELAEMVEEADNKQLLSTTETFGFACAPVNLGLIEHVQYYVWILNRYVNDLPVIFDQIDFDSKDIDYLETAIKCVELYQWLSRHFQNNKFAFDEAILFENKRKAIIQLNHLLSTKTVRTCSSCGKPLEGDSKFAICEQCFRKRRFSHRRPTKRPVEKTRRPRRK